MAVQHLVGIVLGKHPIVEHGEELLAAEQFDEVAALVALEQDLRGVWLLPQDTGP